jgi:hypothetical protein
MLPCVLSEVGNVARAGFAPEVTEAGSGDSWTGFTDLPAAIEDLQIGHVSVAVSSTGCWQFGQITNCATSFH